MMAQGSPITVVVVDDHQALADALDLTLSADPRLAVIGTVGTVREAMRLISVEAPDVLLMDVHLPDGDGLHGIRQVLRTEPRTKVIVLSADEGVDVISEAVTAGAAGFIPKTAPLKDIVEGIVRVHGGGVLFAPETLLQVSAHLTRPRTGWDLTPREREVLQLLAEGIATEGIADRLVVSTHTVRNHIRGILAKLHAHSRLEAVAIAVREELVAVGR